MKKTNIKLPKAKSKSLYQFKKAAGFFETTVTSGDPTNTTSYTLTSTHF